MEPAGVSEILAKIRGLGVPLREYAGVGALSGTKTGFNDAFLLDTPTKERLVDADPKSLEFVKPYLRGQDIQRWHVQWNGLWMLVLKSSGNHPWPWARAGERAEAIFAAKHPRIYARVNKYRDSLVNRQDQGENWWELRACAYWDEFEKPKIIYPEITWRAQWALDELGLYINNTAYILPSADLWILAVSNSPLMWWYSWRHAVHGKDEALRFIREFVQEMPICKPTPEIGDSACDRVSGLIANAKKQQQGRQAFLEWLRLEFGIDKPSQKLQEVTGLDVNRLHGEVKKACGTKRKLTVAAVARLREEHAASIVPVQTLAEEARKLERQVAELVNRAYGLTPEDVDLMWRTAPPRMPGESREEQRARESI